MRALRLAALILGVPEGAGLAVEGQLGLVAAVLAVGADELPAALVDEEFEVVACRGTLEQPLGGSVGRHGAGGGVAHRRRVLLVVTAVYAVVDGGSLRRGAHLDAPVVLTLTADGHADGHVNASRPGGAHVLGQRHHEEAEQGVLCPQLILLHHVRTA